MKQTRIFWLTLCALIIALVTLACAQTNTFAALNLAQTWTALQTFSSGIIISGTAITTETGTGALVRAVGPTLTTATLGSPTINGTPVGTGIETNTMKAGTGSPTYQSASTSYVRVDSTNLTYTVTVPSGWKLQVVASGTIGTLTAAVSCSVALADGSADNTGILQEVSMLPAASFTGAPFSLTYLINGDGASHTINLQYKTSNGADSVFIANASTIKTTMIFRLSPSN